MKEANVKIAAHYIEKGNWVIQNVQGAYQMGKVISIKQDNAAWRKMEIQKDSGEVVKFTIHAHGLITLCCYEANEEDRDDRIIERILRRGRPLCVAHCTMDVDKAKQGLDFKYKSRDGRYFFSDGSSIRLNENGTRTLIDTKGVECDWPVKLRKRE